MLDNDYKFTGLKYFHFQVILTSMASLRLKCLLQVAKKSACLKTLGGKTIHQ